MNNGSITQHVIANRFLHTNSKEASGSIDAKASLSLSEFYDLYKDSDIHHSAKTPLCLFLDHLRRILAIQFKPEGNAVLTVVNAVWLSQLLHGCLDNGKADTAAVWPDIGKYTGYLQCVNYFCRGEPDENAAADFQHRRGKKKGCHGKNSRCFDVYNFYLSVVCGDKPGLMSGCVWVKWIQ